MWNRTRNTILTTMTVMIPVVLILLSLPMAIGGTPNPAPVARTGQTAIFDSGDDGDFQRGVVWPSPRFADNQNGTVTDNLTGLIWLMDLTRFNTSPWNNALAACGNLADDGIDLTDGSTAGEWRLPNIRELRSIIDFDNHHPALPYRHPFFVVPSITAWASTTSLNNINRAWSIDMSVGTMTNDLKNTSNAVWPVRTDSAKKWYPAPTARTGQTISYRSGDDGTWQTGTDWPDPRFTDNENGTVTDTLTGLIWLQDATRFSDLSWADALITCNNLVDDGLALTDGSRAGEWRLPNTQELSSLNDFSRKGPALPTKHRFITEAANNFWTSTTSAARPARAWAVGMGIGKITEMAKGTQNYVWPVRDPLQRRTPIDIVLPVNRPRR
jgi:hypothetical protein